ncbi:RidA family protein [Aromatoleum evansii]|uniref:RidA family protein n=1 Tax=Aromatoleum evansii TaxID=59406 RepID=UPI00145E048D|nr:RidA family protein [Aromatoleum evansii]NMG30195.1 deaminase [Aromatoleum evansii]
MKSIARSLTAMHSDSPEVISSRFIFASGRVAAAPNDAYLVDDIAIQARQAFSNITTTLAAAGAQLSHVEMVTLYIKDLSDLGAVDKIYCEQFGRHRAARSTVKVPNLPGGSRVEIEVLALLPL